MSKRDTIVVDVFEFEPGAAVAGAVMKATNGIRPRLAPKCPSSESGNTTLESLDVVFSTLAEMSRLDFFG